MSQTVSKTVQTLASMACHNFDVYQPILSRPILIRPTCAISHLDTPRCIYIQPLVSYYSMAHQVHCLVDSTVRVMGRLKCRPAGMRARAGGRKVWAAVPFFVVKVGPHLTQCRLGRGVPPYQVVS